MLEDTTLTEFRVRPIDAKRIIEARAGETAYALDSVSHGTCENSEEERKKLASLKTAPSTLAFEFDTQCDNWPYVLETYNADKTLNAIYNYGEHSPKGECFQEKCRFNVGEKVLCLMFEGYNAVFPGIVVSPLTEDYLREFYEKNEDMQISYASAEEAISKWQDFHWDSVIVRPLVRLNNAWEDMPDTVIVNRVYVFPYKKFNI